jgi:hypothetical protein
MQTAIIPVFDQKDAEAVKNCLVFLASVSTKTIMILHNPNIGITDEKVTEPFERVLAALEIAELGAALRRDYSAAAQFHEQFEAKKTERDLAIRDGWSKIPLEERRKIYVQVLNPEYLGTRAIFPLKENYDHDQVFRMLHELQSTWPKDIQHGQFAVVWPRSVLPQVGGAKKEPHAATPLRIEPLAPTELPMSPEDQMRHDLSRWHGKLQAAAKKHGFALPKGADKKPIIDAIMDLEFPKVA